MFFYCSYIERSGLVLSCRDPDEAGVLPEEVLDGLQTGTVTTLPLV